MKKVKTVALTAEIISGLKVLPQEMLPSTLKNPIILNNIQSISLNYHPVPK